MPDSGPNGSQTNSAKPPYSEVAITANDRVIFRARRPAALVLPLAIFTEIAGIICLLNKATIGWFIVAAPIFALVSTTLLFRPTLELTNEGLVQRQYPFSSLTRWNVIDSFGITRAGNRIILGYKLIDGIPPPKRQPAARLLRAAGCDYDGGYFADSLAGKPEEILQIVKTYWIKQQKLSNIG